MKKVFMVALAVLISAAFVTSVFAQAPAAKPAAPAAPAAEKPAAPAEKAPAPEKKAEKKEAAPKAKTHQYTGVVVKVDESVIVVKGKKGEAVYDIKDVKWVGYKDGKEVAAGDTVIVKGVDMDGKKVAKSVAKKGKAAEKKPAAEKKAPEKKEAPKADAPKAAPAPAPAPAPAK